MTPALLTPPLLEEVTAIFKVLGDATRAQIVYLLTQREHNVTELSQAVGVSHSAVSHHLGRLRAIRLAKSRRDGNQVFYSVDDSHVAALFREALWHLEHVQKAIPDYPFPHKT